MLVITLGDEKRYADPSEDDLGRDRAGYSPTMSQIALYDANHGTWHLGEKARKERFVLYAYKGQVVQAVKINHVEYVADAVPGSESPRSVINGDILVAGDRVYDRYVDKASPIPPQRNPVGYFDAPEDHTTCLCGCDEPTPASKDFLPGHDQTALHDRVRQIGTVRQFIDWFDQMHGYWPEINVIYEPTKLDGTPTGEPHRLRHRLGCDHFYNDGTGRANNRLRLATAKEMASLRPCKTCVGTASKAALDR